MGGPVDGTATHLDLPLSVGDLSVLEIQNILSETESCESQFKRGVVRGVGTNTETKRGGGYPDSLLGTSFETQQSHCLPRVR